MDEKYLLTAVRYIELNPVQAQMVVKPGDYRWSSAQAHLSATDDKLVKVAPLLEMVSNWKEFLADPVHDDQLNLIEMHERTGRPLGDENFITKLTGVRLSSNVKPAG